MTALRHIRYRGSRDVGRNSVWLPPREHAVELVPEMWCLMRDGKCPENENRML